MVVCLGESCRDNNVTLSGIITIIMYLFVFQNTDPIPVRVVHDTFSQLGGGVVPVGAILQLGSSSNVGIHSLLQSMPEEVPREQVAENNVS